MIVMREEVDPEKGRLNQCTKTPGASKSGGKEIAEDGKSYENSTEGLKMTPGGTQQVPPNLLKKLRRVGSSTAKKTIVRCRYSC